MTDTLTDQMRSGDYSRLEALAVGAFFGSRVEISDLDELTAAIENDPAEVAS